MGLMFLAIPCPPYGPFLRFLAGFLYGFGACIFLGINFLLPEIISKIDLKDLIDWLPHWKDFVDFKGILDLLFGWIPVLLEFLFGWISPGKLMKG